MILDDVITMNSVKSACHVFLFLLLCAQAAMASVPFSEECTWHLKDHRGGVLAAVDDEGKGRRGAIGGFLGGLEGVEKSEKADVLGVTSYLPYGELRQSPGKRAIEGFTGQRRDDETGLDNFNARVYDPSFCRFLQPDPALDPENINGYTYCAGNPVMLTDPDGTSVVGAAVGTLMIAGLAYAGYQIYLANGTLNNAQWYNDNAMPGTEVYNLWVGEDRYEHMGTAVSELTAAGQEIFFMTCMAGMCQESDEVGRPVEKTVRSALVKKYMTNLQKALNLSDEEMAKIIRTYPKDNIVCLCTQCDADASLTAKLRKGGVDVSHISCSEHPSVNVIVDLPDDYVFPDLD